MPLNLFDTVKLTVAIPLTDGGMGAFREPLGVETVYSHQLQLVKPARETISVRAHLLSLLEKLSEEKLTQVRDFTESLLKK
jgi:hypothetical protein